MSKSFLSVLLVILQCSCTASRKFDFNTAYKFRYLRYNPVHVSDSIPPLLVSSDKLTLTSAGQPVIPKPEFKEKTIPIQKELIPDRGNTRTEVKLAYKKSFTANKYAAGKTAVLPFKTYKRKSINHIKSTTGFSDLHPAFQGFIFVAIGFGLIVVGSMITGIQVLPIIIIAGGIVLAVLGFIKIFSQL